MSACVYRFFNAEGELLYVGQTLDLGQRLTNHQSQAVWYLEVSTVTVEHLANREAALVRERQVVADESPRYNVSLRRRNVHVNGVAGRPSGYLPDPAVAAALVATCGLTQKAIAETCHLSPAHLSNILNGKRGASLATACCLAEALKANVEILFPSVARSAA